MKQFYKNITLLTTILSVAVTDTVPYLYSIALPNVADCFQVQVHIVQTTMTFYLIGFAVSGLIYGPLSDYYGRRLIMLIGIVTFVFGSIACCTTSNIILFVLAYSTLGIGSGAVNVMGYVIIKDICSDSECSRTISILNMVGTLFSSIFAPIIASYVISFGYSWKVLFISISFSAIIIFFLIYSKLLETLVMNKSKMSIKELLQELRLKYVSLLQNYRFFGFTLIQGLTSMWMWAYITNYIFIFKSMNIEARYYGYLIAITSLFYILGTLINRRYVSRIGVSRMLTVGLTLPVIFGTLLMCFYFMNKLNIYIIEATLAISNISLALITSNNITSALETIKDTGFGNAFISFCNLMLGAIGTYIVGKFFHYGILPNLLLTVVSSTTAIAIYTALRRYSQT